MNPPWALCASALSWLAGPVLEVLLESEEAGGDEEAEGAAAQLFPKHAITPKALAHARSQRGRSPGSFAQ